MPTHVPERGDIHIKTPILEISASSTLSQAIKKYVAKSRSISPQRICFLIVLAESSSGHAKSEVHSGPMHSVSTETCCVIKILSVIDLMLAVVHPQTKKNGTDNVTVESVMAPSVLAIEWCHHERNPLMYDMVDVYALDGHHLGVIKTEDASWHIPEERDQALAEIWTSAELDLDLSRAASGMRSHPHRFMDIFSKFICIVRADETVENVIREMSKYCIPFVAVLQPFENDVLGIVRPVDVLEAVRDRRLSYEDSISSCVLPASASTRSEKFLWVLRALSREASVWFEDIVDLAHSRAPRPSLIAGFARINVRVMTFDVYKRLLPWALLRTSESRQLLSFLELIAQNLPCIPDTDTARQQLHIALQESAPSLRTIHDAMDWHQTVLVYTAQGSDNGSRLVKDPHHLNVVSYERAKKIKAFFDPVPGRFNFRVRLPPTATSQLRFYTAEDTSIAPHGFHDLMKQLQHMLHPDQTEVLDYARTFSSSPNEEGEFRDKIQQDDVARGPESCFLPVYIGSTGDDTLLSPWDMIYSVQLAVSQDDDAVDLHFRQVDTQFLVSSSMSDQSGVRLVKNKPFGHRTYGCPEGSSPAATPPLRLLIERPLYRAQWPGIVAVTLGVLSGLAYSFALN